MPRQARLDSPGTLHHVIVRGIERRDIFKNNHDRADMVTRMGKLVKETKTDIYAWSLMTNHIHLLIKSGPYGLSQFMMRLLTGYAINYNLRHRRYGYLFQNRYKSIICDEDVYFKELVRYIHLNPLRAEIVKNMTELDQYPWSGHSVIMGYKKRAWQDVNYVLSWFSPRKAKAKNIYRHYLKEGIMEGKRDDLVGGGLIRTLGGWSQVLSKRKSGKKIISDERILGQDEFVERILGEADKQLKRQLAINIIRIEAGKKILNACNREKISVEELRGGSRRGRVSDLRARLAIELVKDYGMTLAEAARQLGVSTSAISKIFARKYNINRSLSR
jgi:REP element-mobilizing transposase RayT